MTASHPQSQARVSILRSGPLRMRATQSTDLDFVRRVEADPQNAPHVEQWSREEHQAALERADCVHTLLETAAEGEPVGYLILEGTEDPEQRILLRRVAIARKGRGFGRAAVKLAIRYAFEILAARSLWLTVSTDNRRAIALYEHLGFVDRGVWRDPETGLEAQPPMRLMLLEAAPLGS